MSFPGIVLTFAFINNIILVQCLGFCPVVHLPRRRLAILTLGGMVTIAMAGAALVATLVNRYVLIGWGLTSLQIMVFVLIGTGIVYALDGAVKRLMPALGLSLGAGAPGMSAHCAIVGTVLLCVRADFSPWESLAAGIASGLGFALALGLIAVIQAKLELENVPRALRGAPITFITAGLLSLGFMALDVVLLRPLVG
jgi:electron transport complex protein RnfA